MLLSSRDETKGCQQREGFEMFINHVMNRTFCARWDSLTWTPSDSIWMIPGTFDCDGNSTL
ncbi:hypothetical protein [Rhizobium phage RHph_X3_2]|nr:hypothetical protein [Rhizobium phage RHph_X3_2]